jgi:DNA invertase Pin-like site-specific DNA recombinase
LGVASFKKVVQNVAMQIGYMRVSTDDQNLDMQRHALEAAGCDAIYEDQGVSGAAVVRDGLTKALTATGEGDVLVVWRLDRLGRSLPHLIDTITGLRDRGAGFRSLQEQIDTTSAGGRFYMHILAALAEFERELIRDRTKEGMKAAKRRGVILGRPAKLAPFQVEEARRMIAEGRTRSEVAALFSVSALTLRRALVA